MQYNVDVMFSTYVSSAQFAGFEKRLGIPRDFEVQLTPFDKKISAEFSAGRGSAEVVSAGPRILLVSANCYEDARVRIGQLYFPLWKVVPATSGEGPTLESSPDGLIEVSLSKGRHAFELFFDIGWPERIGLVITAASLTAIAGGLLFIVVRRRITEVS